MDTLLHPLELAVAWIMVAFHSLFTTLGAPPASGWTWALSIVGLVIVIRILLIPLFVKQIKASRGLQLIQPEMKKIQQKYKGKTDQASRQAMTQETMALYKRTGTNPFASCLPIILQSPVFFALFRVLNGISKHHAIGVLTLTLVKQADQATIFGAPLSATFVHSVLPSTKILAATLIVLMSLTTFTTQRQLMMKNMPASAMDNPFAQQQKILLYVLPLIFLVSGVNFPIGVLIYWLTTNLWSMGQQFYVIRRMPAPGSAAEKAMEERKAKRAKPSTATDGAAARLQDTPRVQDSPGVGSGGPGGRTDANGAAAGPGGSAPGQRQQPKRQKSRSQRRRPPGVEGGVRPQGSGGGRSDAAAIAPSAAVTAPSAAVTGRRRRARRS